MTEVSSTRLYLGNLPRNGMLESINSSPPQRGSLAFFSQDVDVSRRRHTDGSRAGSLAGGRQTLCAPTAQRSHRCGCRCLRVFPPPPSLNLTPFLDVPRWPRNEFLELSIR